MEVGLLTRLANQIACADTRELQPTVPVFDPLSKAHLGAYRFRHLGFLNAARVQVQEEDIRSCGAIADEEERTSLLAAEK